MFGYTLGQVLVGIVVLAAVIAIVYVALREFGIAVPMFVQRIFWIVVCCVIAVVAIKFLLSL